MIKTFVGPNTFLLKQAIDNDIKSYVDEYGDHEFERLNGEENELAVVQSKLRSLPFFSEKKLLIIDEPANIPGFKEDFTSTISDISDAVEVIIVEPKPDRRSSYYKKLQKHTELKQFSELDLPALSRWLSQTASEMAVTLSDNDAKYLIERVGTNQYLLKNELNKLAANNPQITRQLINELCEPVPQSSIFDLIDAAFTGNVKTAIERYENQRAQNIEPQFILSMLARQLHILAITKTAPSNKTNQEIAQEAGIHPYVVQKAREASRRLSLGAVMRSVSELRELDRAQKTSALQLDEALRYFLISTAQKSNN